MGSAYFSTTVGEKDDVVGVQDYGLGGMRGVEFVDGSFPVECHPGIQLYYKGKLSVSVVG
jgi:hypothetical protein